VISKGESVYELDSLVAFTKGDCC